MHRVARRPLPSARASPQFIIDHHNQPQAKWGEKKSDEWEKETGTMAELAPLSALERGREIKSMHYSKVPTTGCSLCCHTWQLAMTVLSMLPYMAVCGPR